MPQHTPPTFRVHSEWPGIAHALFSAEDLAVGSQAQKATRSLPPKKRLLVAVGAPGLHHLRLPPSPVAPSSASSRRGPRCQCLPGACGRGSSGAAHVPTKKLKKTSQHDHQPEAALDSGLATRCYPTSPRGLAKWARREFSRDSRSADELHKLIGERVHCAVVHMSDNLRSSELAAKSFSPQSTAQKSLLTGLHVVLFGSGLLQCTLSLQTSRMDRIHLHQAVSHATCR